jgi:hypothetical protein
MKNLVRDVMHKHLRERPEHVGSLIEIKLCKTHLWPANFMDKIEGLSSNLELVEWGFKKMATNYGDSVVMWCTWWKIFTATWKGIV